MTRFGFALAMAAIVAAAAWTYDVNYRTGRTLERIRGLRAEIAAEREAIQVLRIEWAHLNAPERLAKLVERYNDRLALVPAEPRHFGSTSAIPFRPDAEPEPADTVSTGGG